MCEHWSGRLCHSPPHTSYEPNTVPTEEVVVLTGGDSDVNQDVHAIALTLLHQRQPQPIVQGSRPHAGGNSLLLHRTNIQNVGSRLYLGQAVDQERAHWIGQGRQALQHQRRHCEVAVRQYEEAARQRLHYAVEHANSTAHLEMTPACSII